MPASQLITVDNRHRTTLADAEPGKYTVEVEPDGTLVLRPAVIMSRAEAALLQNTALMASIEDARQHPERRAARPPRRSVAAQ